MRTQKFYLNAVHGSLEYCLAILNPKAVPVDLYLEPTTLCNLKCSACPTGEGLQEIKERTELSIIKNYYEEYSQYLVKWHLFNWGEPTLHKDFTSILNLLSQGSFDLHISSNFSLPLDDDALESIYNALTRNLILKIDMDGFTHHTQSEYRKGSKIEIVKENCRKLSSLIKSKSNQFNSRIRLPWIAFLEFPHNLHELDECKNFASDLGFAFKTYDSPFVKGQGYSPVSLKPSEAKQGCAWLYSTLLVSPLSSKLLPCCGVWSDKHSIPLADPTASKAHNIWSQSKLMNSRRILSKKRQNYSNNQLNTIFSFNNANISGMDLSQSNDTVDKCVTCYLGGIYHQGKSLLYDTASRYVKHRFPDVLDLFKSILFKLDDKKNIYAIGYLEDIVLQLNKTLGDKSPSERSINDYSALIHGLSGLPNL